VGILYGVERNIQSDLAVERCCRLQHGLTDHCGAQDGMCSAGGWPASLPTDARNQPLG
jgi:hypothetical protein